MRGAVLRVTALLAIAAVVPGCFDRQPEARMCAAPEDPAASPAPLGWPDVAPMFAQRCARCHRPGGSGGFSLVSYADVHGRRGQVEAAIASGHMPPWPPNPCCGEFQNARGLGQDEKATLSGWLLQGAPEVSPLDVSPPQTPSLDRVDLTLEMPGPYLPAPPRGATDDTRCFVLDWPLTSPRYVTGVEILPGHGPQMHHGLVLISSAKDAEQLRALDAKDQAPGWSCPGGLVGAFKGFLGGSFFEPMVFRPGFGHEVLPGDVVVLSMHYSAPPEGGFEPDLTRVRLRLQEEPAKRLLSLNLYNPAWVAGGMSIPKGAEDVRHAYAEDFVLHNGDRPFLLHSVSLHMHERGKAGQVAILRANGERTCLLQIDHWHHEWQGDFTFVEPVRLEKGDRVLIECRFDNGPDNQRLVDGEREPPRTLNWGEDQEMCVAFLIASVDG